MSLGKYATDIQRIVAVMQADGYEVLAVNCRYGQAPSYQADVDGKTKGWSYAFEGQVMVTFIDHTAEPLGPNGQEALEVFIEGSTFGYHLTMWETLGFRGPDPEKDQEGHDAYLAQVAEWREANPIPDVLLDAVKLYPNHWAAERYGYQVPA